MRHGRVVVGGCAGWWLALAAFAFGLVPCAAKASTVVVVPVQVDSGILPEQVEEASAELLRLLRVQGFNPVSSGQAAPIAESEQRTGAFPKGMSPDHCVTPECASAFRKLFDATFAVQLTLFRERSRPGSVAIALIESVERVYGATASVEAGDIAGAVRSAFEQAREKQADGEGPWLSVNGQPRGATVYVDGFEYGRIPFEKRRIAAGSHRLEVRADGYRTEARLLEVPARIDHEEAVAIELGRATHRAPKVSRTWDWVVGGALFVAGAAHLGLGVYQKQRSGDCAHYLDGACVERYGDRSGLRQENLLMAVGALGIVGSVGWVWGAPIGRIRVRAGADHALISWGRSF